MYIMMIYLSVFFFFQAEDGIRDGTVTGVQTCALPIYGRDIAPLPGQDAQRMPGEPGYGGGLGALAADIADGEPPTAPGNLEHVVEVAANLVSLASCLVPGRQVHARDGRQLGRQQAVL